MTSTLATHKAFHGWWCLGRNSIFPVKIRIAAGMAAYIGGVGLAVPRDGWSAEP